MTRFTRSRPVRLPLYLAAVLCLGLPALAAAQTRLLRFPAIHGDKVAFTYALDHSSHHQAPLVLGDDHLVRPEFRIAWA